MTPAKAARDDPWKGGEMNETELTPLLLYVEEAAKVLRTSRSDMYRLIQKGDVETVPVGRGQRVVYESLMAYVNRLRQAS